MFIHTCLLFRRLPLLLAGVFLLLSAVTPAQAGLFWPFRRAKQKVVPAQAENFYRYAAPQPPPVQGAWQPRPYYPPMPPQPGYEGYGYGQRPALPALPPPPYQPAVYRAQPPMPYPQPQYQQVVYRVQPAQAPEAPRGGSGLAGAMWGECERLSRLGLRYQFGSMDPSSGGLDCSGSVKYVLERSGVRGVPRTASDQYVWLEKAGRLTPLGRGANGDWILNRLRPGDLLFWRGTYVTNRVPDVSHVMIYLGRDTRTGRAMMFGARSNTSRTGIHGHAVDIFEFNPVPKGKSEFIGFGSVPQ